MKIFDRKSVQAAITPDPGEAKRMMRRWQEAFERDPELVRDVIALGGVLSLPIETYQNGEIQRDPVDPIRAARDEGSRLLAVKMLSLGAIGVPELRTMLEKNYEL